MEIKNLFGYAAALSLLSIGLLSCEKPAEDDDNGGNPPTVTVRYSVKVTEVTETSAKAVPAGQVTASARKGKVAKAGYRTLSPLKTVYKVR